MHENSQYITLQGCKVRDHVVNMSDVMMSTSAENMSKEPTKGDVYDDLLAHRDAISQPYSPPPVNTKE